MGDRTEPGKARLARLAAAPYARAACVALLAAAAAAQAVAQAMTIGGAGRPGGSPGVLAAEYVLPLSLLALLATVPLAVYRPAVAAVAVTFGNAVALSCFGQVTAGGVLAELAAACWLAAAGGLRRPRAGPGANGATPGRYLAVGLALPFAVIALAGGGRAAVLLAVAVPVAAGTGIAAWSGRLARTGTAAGAALADTLLAHTARGERARIARELHDVVAHHISMIAVLSETGRLATPGLPEAGARKFAEIGDTARAGLTEMRRLLGVLGEDAATADPAPAHRAGRQPQPGLAQLTGLIDAARNASAAGIRLIISGPVTPADPGVELAAYRIVQEALTNARRHAPGAAVDVELCYGPGSLRLRVRDNGPGLAGGPRSGDDAARARVAGDAAWLPAAGRTADAGHGLAGLRERAFSAGGSLYTATAPGGGFLVEAMLPTGGDLVPAPPPAGAGGITAGAAR